MSDHSYEHMNASTPHIRDLARRLIAFEAVRNPSDGPVGAVLRACETLREPLAKFVGVVGFRSLLSRALTMATFLSPPLSSLRMRPDGSLEGLDVLDQDQVADAGTVVLAQLLGLLVIFIGEPLMLRLVHDVWPDANEAEMDRIGEGQS